MGKVDATTFNAQVEQLARGNSTNHGVQVCFDPLALAFTIYGKADIPEAQSLQAKLERLNRALRVCASDTRLLMALQLLGIWTDGTDEEVRGVMGDVVKLRPQGRKAIFTLTSSGDQFRVWYGFPGHIDPHHVDSCGHGLLFGIYGEAREVERYRAAFVKAAGLAEFRESRLGTRIYIGS